MTLRLAGYAVEQLLGSGGSGQVWRARELATGEVVALKRAHPGSPAAAVAALARAAELLGGLPTPYVVRLRDVVGDVLVLDHAAGGPLSALLARRGCLEPGEVVTVAAPLAEALAACHAAGLVHGDVAPGNVLFTETGMPLLADLVGEAPEVRGTAEYVDPAVARGGVPDAAADVWALGALCHHLLAGTPPHDGRDAADVLGAAAAGERAPLGLLAPHVPRALVEVVEQALADDPAARPTAADLAVALPRAHPPQVVRLHGQPPAAPAADLRETEVVRPVPEPPVLAALRRPPRGALAGVAVVLALLVAGVGWAVRDAREAATRVTAVPLAPVRPSPARPAPRPAAAPAPSGDPAPPGAPADDPAPVTAGPAAPATPRGAPAAGTGPAWAQVLAELDARREQAWARADPALLGQVWVAGSGALAADVAALQGLRAAGLTATGVRHELRSVQVRATGADRVALRVVDALPAQQVRDGSGTVVQERPPRAEAAFDVELSRAPGGWRIAALARA